MAARASKNNRDRGRERRDLLLFLVILLLGFVCLLVAAQMAVRPEREWHVPANMLSEIDPAEGLDTGGVPIEPLRPEVMTPPPWDPIRILTPAGTAVAVPPATFAPAPTNTSTPQAAAIVPTPTAPPSPTPTPTPTSTPMPTITPTPTPTTAPTATDTPSPTSTSQPPTRRATDTPTTPTDTPTPTETPTYTPMPPPSVLSITPNQGVNSAPVPVVITGENFFGIPTATLRMSELITISDATADTLTGTVPAGLIPGVYALTVRNPDGRSGTLSPAYTAFSPATMLETGLVSTFGTAATSPGEGDNDQVQVIFLEVPDTTEETLYVHIFDPDVGGDLDEQQGGAWDTTTTFSLYGGSGAYTNPAARQATFATTTDPGVRSGTPITDQTFAASDTLNRIWYLFATVAPGQGEPVGGKRVFKLSVVGANSGDDGNLYNVALSTSSSSPNEAPADGRVFAYSWTVPLASNAPRWLYPYVPGGTEFFEQHNWDLDNSVGAMTLYTPIRTLDVPEDGISGDGAEASSRHNVDVNEDVATWTVKMRFSVTGPWEDLTFWVEDESGGALAIFTRPTKTSPP